MKTVLSSFSVFLMIGTAMILWTISPVHAQQLTASVDISAKAARVLLAKDTNVVLLDVRSPREYNEERIANTPLMPLQYLEKRISDLNQYKHKKIVVYCYSGNRSELAVEILREYGFNALSMQGGILQWKAQQYPTISGAVR
ncbi:MAG: rhodanese-like domain-containing protein [Bacteriovoracaceae bacterium]|nr:rhodanese-like domain-containing protein [Bacteroidota bacterium]